MQSKLELSLSLTIDWLKFAESKNAMLIAAHGAAIFGIFTLLESGSISNSMYVFYIYQALLFLFLGAVFCLISFIPQVDVPWIESINPTKEEDNLLAYADIAKYDSKLYLEAIYKQEAIDLNEINPFEEDLAELIVIYSRIAMRKYSLFNSGVWCTLSAIVTPVIALIIYLIRKSHIKARA
ncbi:MAG: DUF5706 domain-containing protein [Gammaproteobacteria bacterium]|nr:DUF5706 domain-containing protein [Gammaproteobacteria bacterium]